jgi:hypothetical protein
LGDSYNYITQAPANDIHKTSTMHLIATIVKLLSPLRPMFAGSPTQNLTELLSTDAITADLNLLVEI